MLAPTITSGSETLLDTDLEPCPHEHTTAERSVVRRLPRRRRIRVLVHMPHVAAYKGTTTTAELVYGCRFPVAVGDAVLCPPMPRDPERTWKTGIVTAMNGSGYTGRVRQVRPIDEGEDLA